MGECSLAHPVDSRIQARELSSVRQIVRSFIRQLEMIPWQRNVALYVAMFFRSSNRNASIEIMNKQKIVDQNEEWRSIKQISDWRMDRDCGCEATAAEPWKSYIAIKDTLGYFVKVAAFRGILASFPQICFCVYDSLWSWFFYKTFQRCISNKSWVNFTSFSQRQLVLETFTKNPGEAQPF